MTFPPPPDQPAPQPVPKGAGLGVTSLVSSLIGLVVFAWIPLAGIVFGVPLGLVGSVFGIIAIVKAPGRAGQGKGLGVAGLVLGVVTIPVAVLGTLLLGNDAAVLFETTVV